MSVRTTDTSSKGFGPRKVYRGRSLSFYNTQKTGGGTSLPRLLLSIVLDGLVLNLDAGNTSSYPGSGTTWTDLSGSGKNATLSNGPTYSSDDGGSIVFDGVNDFASIGSPSPLSGTQLFTFEIWVNFTSISGNFGGLNKSAWLFAGGTGGGSGQPELGVLSADNTSFTPDTLFFGRGSGGNVGSCLVSVSSLMSNGNWYQIVLVRSSTNTQEVYLNGVQIGTGNISNSFSDGITNFGSIENNPNYSGYLNGKISNIKIYNRALTAAEVQQNYNALVGRFPPSIVLDGLVLNLDAGNTSSYPGSGTTWTDLSGNGNNGTLTNGPTYSSDDGGAIVFDGTDDYVSSIDLSSYTNLTIEMWIYEARDIPNLSGIPGEPGGEGDILTYNGTGTGGSFTFSDNSFGVKFRTDGNFNAGRSFTITQVPQQNQWYRFCYIKNGSLWINDTEYTSASGSENTYGVLDIGRTRTGIAQPLNGKISNVRVYNRSLTAAEVQQNYNALVGRFSP